MQIEPVRRSEFAAELTKNPWVDTLRPLVEAAAENDFDSEDAYKLPFPNADELVKEQRRMGEATRRLGASMRSKIVEGTSLLFWFRPAVTRTKTTEDEVQREEQPKSKPSK